MLVEWKWLLFPFSQAVWRSSLQLHNQPSKSTYVGSSQTFNNGVLVKIPYKRHDVVSQLPYDCRQGFTKS